MSLTHLFDIVIWVLSEAYYNIISANLITISTVLDFLKYGNVAP